MYFGDVRLFGFGRIGRLTACGQGAVSVDNHFGGSVHTRFT